jgi:hypothetical protein
MPCLSRERSLTIIEEEKAMCETCLENKKLKEYVKRIQRENAEEMQAFHKESIPIIERNREKWLATEKVEYSVIPTMAEIEDLIDRVQAIDKEIEQEKEGESYEY